MGRPLRKDVIEAMGLKASGKLLEKQVGYNKYTVKDSNEVVMLSEEEDLENGKVVLKIKDQPILKILRNVIQLPTETIAYQVNTEGKMVIDGEVVSFDESSAEEPVEEPAEEVVEDKSEESEVVEEPAEEATEEPVKEEVIAE
jgi:hypothetical protein